MDEQLSIRLLDIDDQEEMGAMAARVAHLSGRDGHPIFNPFDDVEPWGLKRFGTTRQDGWSIRVTESGWHRSFGILAPSGCVHGVLTLEHSPPLVSHRHRCLLSMELDQPLWGKGWGTRLLRHAVDWAVAQPSIRWIDLGVFANNAHAVRLYTGAGFVEVGRREDRFRVHGQQITDIQMSLDLDTSRG